jgi:hypothetical protein
MPPSSTCPSWPRALGALPGDTSPVVVTCQRRASRSVAQAMSSALAAATRARRGDRTPTPSRRSPPPPSRPRPPRVRSPRPATSSRPTTRAAAFLAVPHGVTLAEILPATARASRPADTPRGPRGCDSRGPCGRQSLCVPSGCDTRGLSHRSRGAPPHAELQHCGPATHLRRPPRGERRGERTRGQRTRGARRCATRAAAASPAVTSPARRSAPCEARGPPARIDVTALDDGAAASAATGTSPRR